MGKGYSDYVYAVKVYPGDLGTKGGILTDEFARALREDGSVIDGLYAAGNCSASGWDALIRGLDLLWGRPRSSGTSARGTWPDGPTSRLTPSLHQPAE
jgi:hypothetical protein